MGPGITLAILKSKEMRMAKSAAGLVVLLNASQVDMLLQANPDMRGRISIIDVQGL